MVSDMSDDYRDALDMMIENERNNIDAEIAILRLLYVFYDRVQVLCLATAIVSFSSMLGLTSDDGWSMSGFLVGLVCFNAIYISGYNEGKTKCPPAP